MFPIKTAPIVLDPKTWERIISSVLLMDPRFKQVGLHRAPASLNDNSMGDDFDPNLGAFYSATSWPYGFKNLKRKRKKPPS